MSWRSQFDDRKRRQKLCVQFRKTFGNGDDVEGKAIAWAD
jgi:hypothetical protein